MGRNDREAVYLIDLTAAALTHQAPPKPEADLDFALLSRLVGAHRIGALLYPTVQEISGVDDGFLKSVREDCQKGILRDAMQQDAIEEFEALVTAAGIDYMLLKGTVLKRYYEKSYQRMMGDVDVLIHPRDRERVRAVMEGAGYTVSLFGELYDDVYHRAPILNFEIHHALGKEEHFPVDYFDAVWERALTLPQNPRHHEMCPEDYYLYFIIHTAKHCRNHGTGIRALIDLWVLRHGGFPDFDRARVDAVLSDFGLLKFERAFCELCEVWFEGREGGAFHEEMRSFLLLDSGLYGSFSNAFFDKSISEDFEHAHKSKRQLFIRRIFPPYRWMSQKYPILQKAKFLLPLFWFWRNLLVLCSPKKWKSEKRLYQEVTRGMESQRRIRAYLGFTETRFGKPQDEMKQERKE